MYNILFALLWRVANELPHSNASLGEFLVILNFLPGALRFPILTLVDLWFEVLTIFMIFGYKDNENPAALEVARSMNIHNRMIRK